MFSTTSKLLSPSMKILSTTVSRQNYSTTTTFRLASHRILQSSRNTILSKRQNLNSSRQSQNRFFSDAKPKETVAKEQATKSSSGGSSSGSGDSSGPGWWRSPEFWGGLGALAGWGMSGAAIYDASLQGPEVISLTMTPVLMVYSTLFARWAWVVQPRNLLLMWCHIANVVAQTNQLRRALEYKKANGQEKEVNDMLENVAKIGAGTAVAIAAGPKIRSALTNANLGIVSSIAAAPAGPFTVHFWAPMSKWFISGASFLDLNRPTDKISLPQYTALTLTGFFFTRYALLVTPINYTLCSVNIALFVSSAWHLGRKLKADYIDGSEEKKDE